MFSGLSKKWITECYSGPNFRWSIIYKFGKTVMWTLSGAGIAVPFEIEGKFLMLY